MFSCISGISPYRAHHPLYGVAFDLQQVHEESKVL